MPERGRKNHPEHSECGGSDSDPHHDDGVAAVGITGKKKLAEYAREETSERDYSNLTIGKTEFVANVSEESEHAAVAQRHESSEQEQQDHRPGEGMLALVRLGRRNAVFHVSVPLVVIQPSRVGRHRAVLSEIE